MNIEDDLLNLQLQKLRQSVLDVSQQKITQSKQPYSFHKQLQQKMKNKSYSSFDSNKQIDVLQAGQYLKLICNQKKYLSKKRADKINQLNQSLKIQQEDFKYLFMIATQANYYKLEYPGYYQKILQQMDKYPKNMFSSIDKDIHRTFCNGNPNQQSLRKVLLAFAIRNPNLLYCQGMNYLVAYFLINSVSQQQTFWIIVCLIQNILPEDYFRDLSTISITTQIFADILPYLFPEMEKQMKNIGMDCSLFVVSWFVCLFTKGFLNSVSAYLIAKLILQRRNHSFGYVLLKLSFGVIAAILGRDQPFSFRPEFSAFRDKFQQSVIEITLLEIKLGIQYVELNEQHFMKLEKYYRQKRQQRHISALQKDINTKRLSLPICNQQYPICLQRIQIQRKVGSISEVIITKNGYQMMSQYIENYFDQQPKKQMICTIYTHIEDCLLYREQHICQTNLFLNEKVDLSKKLDTKISLRHEQSFMLERQKLEQAQGSISSEIQIKGMYSKPNEKLRELSGYFVVDEDFKFSSDQQSDDNELIEDFVVNKQNNQTIKSSDSFDQPFNLAKQLIKHQIDQDWINNQQGFKTLQEIQKIKQIENKEIDDKSKQIILLSQQEIKNQVGQKINTSSQKQIKSQKQTNFFNKQKIWNFFGRTWKKVIKIKEEELNN